MRWLFVLMCLLALCVTTGTLAQSVGREQDVKHFFETTTYVVLDNNPMSEWNMKMRELAGRHWHVTPLKFIDDNEFENLRKDMDKSFIVRMKFRFPKDKVKANYIYFSIVNGAAVRSMTDMPEICSVPLGYETADQSSWAYKLGSLLQFAQKHIQKLKEDPSIIGENVLQYYNKNMSSMRGKELWVVQEDLAPEVRSLANIRKVYDGVVRIVTPEDIETAINDRREDVVYLHKVGPSRSNVKARVYKCLIGAGDDKFYYFDYHMMSASKGDGLLKEDFKRLNRRN